MSESVRHGLGAGMRSVLTAVPRHERPLVRARVGRLHDLVAQQPGISRRLRRRACVQVAAIAPHLPPARLSLLVWHTLWSYRLDDRIEAPGVEVAAVARLGEQVAAVAAGEPAAGDPAAGDPAAGAGDPLLADLGWAARELSRHDPTGEVVRWYADALRDTLAAEADQLRLDRAVAAGDSPPPTAEQYLELAARNVNYRSFAYALLALTGDALAAAQLRCVDTALWHASYAVRLANDLRGVAQDQARATLNVLGLRTAAGTAVTAGYAWGEADRHLRAHDSVLQSLAGAGVFPPRTSQVLIRSAAQVVRLYRQTDLR